MVDDPLFLHLRKLPAATSEETLTLVVEILWKSRKTGLAPHEKTRLQSLLNLPTLQELDPVLACLRLIIRKCVHEKLTSEHVQSSFPADLSVELQSTLVMVLQKYQNQWMEEASRDQPLWQRTRVSHQVRFNMSPALPPLPASEQSSSLWPRQDDATNYPNGNNFCGSVPSKDDPNLPRIPTIPLQRDNGSFDNLAILPRLKSMTWTMENRNSTPANRVAIITLKLQDYTKSPSGEIEVKFQLSKDTLEAMLRSMTYISEQLSNTVVPPSEPSSKKPRR
ncbi:Protein FAR1-RELATED SEQUENCE 3 [Cocos nucifera]|uniref:Protein FAR1-RELATED SEQUENCE 3 n=1 Tax=Cocos nucifera TaxID=13894 RepID=A0A8K0IRJ8_COCNU|nr:Protein FAR1-RELATED SEQUENCE 3 [Cocos nucifera]